MIRIIGSIEKYASLFEDYGPNQPVIDSIFSGYNPGALWVDRNDPGRNVLLMTEYGFVFGWGERLSELLYRKASEKKKAYTYIPNVNMPEEIGVPFQRVEFFGPNHLGSLEQSQLPSGSFLVSIDAKNLERSNWKGVLLEIFGTPQAFERSGGGIALTNGRTFLGEALIGFVGKKYVEIGTVTHPDHRGKGYSTLACAELIKWLSARNLLAYWSCNVANLGSMKVAEKLGFTSSRPYTVYRVDPDKLFNKHAK